MRRKIDVIFTQSDIDESDMVMTLLHHGIGVIQLNRVSDNRFSLLVEMENMTDANNALCSLGKQFLMSMCDTQMQLRPEVRAFAEQMETTLRANHHKGTWKKCPLEWLMARAKLEMEELNVAVLEEQDHGPYESHLIRSTVASEAVDVANMCMFMADITGGLDYDGAS